MNNFERIKNMTIEELAHFINCDSCVYLAPSGCYAVKQESCHIGKKLWLEREVD